ncbi:hypothetical protein [Mucilaginibacter oryzae]|nr:hypothetical protein [Mucilaginibacter oryzae]
MIEEEQDPSPEYIKGFNLMYFFKQNMPENRPAAFIGQSGRRPL